MLHLGHSFLWCWNSDTSESRWETPGKFWNMALKKDGENLLDRSCEKCRSVTKGQRERNILRTGKGRKANWIGQILLRNCLLKHAIKGKLEGRIEVVGRREWRRKQLLDDLKETRRHRKLKEEALDRAAWRTRFERGLESASKTDYGMTEWIREPVAVACHKMKSVLQI